MSYYLYDLDTSPTVRTVILDDMTLLVEGFSLEEERPYDLMLLSDGSYHQEAMNKKPCVLTLTGRIAPSEEMDLLEFFRRAIGQKTAFSFSFGEMLFADMRICRYRLKAEEGARIAAYSLTLVGSTHQPYTDDEVEILPFSVRDPEQTMTDGKEGQSI